MLLKGSDTAVSCCLLGTQKERRTRESAEPGQRHERCELENTQWKGKHEVEASMTEEGGGGHFAVAAAAGAAAGAGGTSADSINCTINFAVL
jgi:hypothetical protein